MRHKSDRPYAWEERGENSLLTNFHFPVEPRCQNAALQTCGGGKALVGDALGQRGRAPRGSPRSRAAPGVSGRATEGPHPRGELPAPGPPLSLSTDHLLGGAVTGITRPRSPRARRPPCPVHPEHPWGNRSALAPALAEGERRPRPGRGLGAPRHVLPAPSGAARGGTKHGGKCSPPFKAPKTRQAARPPPLRSRRHREGPRPAPRPRGRGE